MVQRRGHFDTIQTATGSVLTVDKTASISELFLIAHNKQETDANYELESGYNAAVVGPWTVGNGFTFTIADGGRFMVLND